MPKKRFLYCLIVVTFIVKSLILESFSFENLVKISTGWLVAFGMWWIADYFYNKNKNSAEDS